MYHFLRLVFLAILSLFTLPLLAQQHFQRLAILDVQHYRFELGLQDINNEIKGTATVSIRFLQPVTQFSLDLVKKNVAGKGMTVNAITLDGQILAFTHQGESLNIQMPKPAQIQDLYAFRIEYQGIPIDGLIIDKNKFGARTFFGDNWPDRGHHWLPVVDHPSDKASVEFLITAPEHYQVVANGIQLEESNLPNGLKLTHWSETSPLAPKVMTIGVAAFATQLAAEVQGVPVSSWVYPENRKEGFYDYAPAQQPLAFFSSHIAPYPFRKLANVQSKTRFGGLENAGCIFYFENSVNGKREREALLSHEIAHQWFGNSASEANWHHVWLSEGFATYFTDLYFEHEHGRATMVQRMQNERADVLAFDKRHIAPIVDTTITDYQNDLLSTNVYQKASWVLHMLRHELGDNAFWAGIRAYYQQFQYGNALTDDFRRAMELASGKKLGAFFQQWLFTAGHPKIQATWSFNAARKELTVVVKQTGTLFQFPLDLGVFYAADGLPLIQTCIVTKTEEQFVFKVEQAPMKLMLDPNTWLLMEGEIKP